MHYIDWLIVVLPLLLVTYIGFRSQRYVKGVSDFLSAGRVAGRYVICVANGEAGLGLISLIALFEVYYNSGIACKFWSFISIPIGIIVLLKGFCVYRYRESRAMTMGQFLEMRYSKGFRIYAGILQSISGVLNYAIFPAVGSRFLVYFCDLPITVTLFGSWTIPTFMLVMAIFLSVAVFVSSIGGQITIMSTDCIQGIISYPLYAIVVICLISKFSWFKDIVPPMMYRPEGQSFINPFDISKLRDFNMFYVAVGVFNTIFNRMAWAGSQGYNSAAKNAHEQKMGGVLGTWKSGFSTVMILLLAICAYSFLNSGHFKSEAKKIRSDLAQKTMEDVIKTSWKDCDYIRQDFNTYLETGVLSPKLQEYVALAEEQAANRANEIQESKDKWNIDKNITNSEKKSHVPAEFIDPASLEKDVAMGTKILQGYNIAENETISSQSYMTIFGQMKVPMAIKTILPIGVTGVFCAMCIFMLISTDTTYIHSWSSIIVQDVVIPIYGKKLSPKQHIKLLRILIALVALFAFVFSSFFGQVDYIMMFLAITGMIWLGGAGPCIVFGLYWKKATAAAAYVALTVGSGLAVTGIIVQKCWENHIYPLLEQKGLVGDVAIWLENMSKPFNPYIDWQMSPTKFPINSQELFFMTMMTSILLFVVISLLTCKKPCNMDKLFHRGKYRIEGKEIVREKLTLKSALRQLIGIDSQYTKGDRILAYAVFGYCLIWQFLISYVLVIVWNKVTPWPLHWWGKWYFFETVIVNGLIVGMITTVWYTIGGTRDLIRMFKDLEAKETDDADDGSVTEHLGQEQIDDDDQEKSTINAAS